LIVKNEKMCFFRGSDADPKKGPKEVIDVHLNLRFVLLRRIWGILKVLKRCEYEMFKDYKNAEISSFKMVLNSNIYTFLAFVLDLP
jgi:hypothetical protein